MTTKLLHYILYRIYHSAKQAGLDANNFRNGVWNWGLGNGDWEIWETGIHHIDYLLLSSPSLLALLSAPFSTTIREEESLILDAMTATTFLNLTTIQYIDI